MCGISVLSVLACWTEVTGQFGGGLVGVIVCSRVLRHDGVSVETGHA